MRSNVSFSLKKQWAAVSLAFIVALTPLAASGAAYAAPAVPQVASSAQASITINAVWAPYDNSAITSAGNCEARRTWLINNVNWITTANSRCQKFSIPACPTARTIWKVMVLTGSGTRSVVREEAPLEAAAC